MGTSWASIILYPPFENVLSVHLLLFASRLSRYFDYKICSHKNVLRNGIRSKRRRSKWIQYSRENLFKFILILFEFHFFLILCLRQYGISKHSLYLFGSTPSIINSDSYRCITSSTEGLIDFFQHLNNQILRRRRRLDQLRKFYAFTEVFLLLVLFWSSKKTQITSAAIYNVMYYVLFPMFLMLIIYKKHKFLARMIILYCLYDYLAYAYNGET